MDIVLLFIGIITLLFNRVSYAIAIMFALLTSYFGLGSNISATIMVHSVSDCGIILFILIWLYESLLHKHSAFSVPNCIKIPICIFSFFLIVIVLYDFFARGTDLISIIQTYRHWILLIFAIPFFKVIETRAVENSLKIIFFISILASVFILVDFYFNLHLIRTESLEYISQTGSYYERAAIPTTFCVFYMLLSLTGYFRFSPIIRYVAFGIFFISIVASMIRSLILVSLVAILFVMVFINKTKTKNVIAAAILFVMLFLIIFTHEGVSNRMKEGFDEMAVITNQNSFSYDGNLVFRLELLNERARYVASSMDRFLLGIGGVREQDFRQVFYIGLNGAQLDTSDIAWPLLLLRLGYLGTLIFIFIWLGYLTTLFRTRNIIGKTGRVFLVANIFTSFCSSFPSNGTFWLFITMILAISTENLNKQKLIDYKLRVMRQKFKNKVSINDNP